MFGYVSPDKPDMKIWEYDVYRAYYCSICKTIGRRSGQAPRLALSYDLSFLALLLDALNEKPRVVHLERCVAHPAKKHLVVETNPCIEYASDMNVLLAYHQRQDKWSDEHSIKGLAGATVLRNAGMKAGKRWPEQKKAIEEGLQKLGNLEKNACSVLDEVAEAFSEIMKVLFWDTTSVAGFTY
jgi:hypothetical protein